MNRVLLERISLSCQGNGVTQINPLLTKIFDFVKRKSPAKKAENKSTQPRFLSLLYACILFTETIIETSKHCQKNLLYSHKKSLIYIIQSYFTPVFLNTVF